jgi:tRNA A-37 threonylcarbamoyl transferase component Bud32
MNPDQPNEETILEQALSFASVEERNAYLRGACAGNEDLQKRVESLIEAHEAAGGFLSKKSASGRRLAFESALEVKPGDCIGRYKLLQQIGEGGCGVVYMAEQEEPVRRRVALKIIKLGMDTKNVIARFEAERQALALMDHASIAKVLDAGSTENGRPYFVMELVRGTKITDYCDEKQLPTEERLELFRQVCHAIQHAHQKGIIHRDIKPSNVLVTVNDGVAVPKVIDFGIAKATTDQRLTDKTVFTAFEQFIGTPAYMSPEQAEVTSMDVDTRSDIYSLGVLLYELLTGKPPFDPKELLAIGLDEMRRAIRETEPERPSTRVSKFVGEESTTTAKRRGLEPPKLANVLKGDLDWIVMKCLEKDPGHRYQTANGLAMDLQRHLSNEPVVAGPPSAVYRLQKFIRRNQVLVAAGAVVTAALVLGIVGSTWQALRAMRAEHEQRRLRRLAQADEAKAKAEAAKSYQIAQLLKEMLDGVGPSKALGRDTTMLREILDKTAERLGVELTNQPEVELELRSTLGKTYEALGLYEQMEQMARQSLALARTKLGEENAFVAGALSQLGMAQFQRANYEQAASTHKEALALRRKLFGQENLDVAESLSALGLALQFGGRLTEGASLQQEAVALVRKVAGNEHPYLADALTALADNLKQLGRLDEAEAADREAVAVLRKLPDKQADLAGALNNLANVLVAQGRAAEAEQADREALTLRRKFLGAEHPDVAESLTGLARDLLGRGNYAEAEVLAREGLAMQKKFLGEEHDVIAETLVMLANALKSQEKLAEAEIHMRQALALARKVLGNENPSIPIYLNELGLLLYREDKLGEAEEALRESLELYKKSLGNEHSYIASALGNLALVLKARGDLARSETLLRQALAMHRKLLGNENPRIAFSLDNLARTLRDEGRLSEAEDAACEALSIRRHALSADHPDVLHAMGTLASVLWRAGRSAEAEALYRDQINGLLARIPADELEVAAALADLSHILLTEERFAEAEEFARESLMIREKKLADDWVTFNTLSLLGSSLLAQKKYVEAEPLLLSGYEGMEQREAKVRSANGEPPLKEALQRLVQLYQATGQTEQAAEWRKRWSEALDSQAAWTTNRGAK